jgi:hypothetical protein
MTRATRRLVTIDWLFAVALFVAVLAVPVSTWPLWLRVVLGLAGVCLIVTSILVTRRMADTHDMAWPAQRRRLIVISPLFAIMGVLALLVAGRLSSAISVMLIPALCSCSGTLFQMGQRRRVGDRRHCPNCDYPCDHEPGTEPVRCPECGTPWLGRWEVGDWKGRPKLKAAGIAIMVLGLGLMFVQFQFQTGSSWTPTRALLWQARNDVGNNSLWNQVAARSLTPEQTASLADSIIEGLPTSGTTIAGGAGWLGDRIAAKDLSPERCELALDALSWIRVVPTSKRTDDGRVQVAIQAWTPAHAARLQHAMLIESIQLEPDGQTSGRLPVPVIAFPFQPDSRFGRDAWPSIWLDDVPHDAREARVRVTYWHVAWTYPNRASVGWDLVDTPSNPAGIIARRRKEKVFQITLD